MRLTLLVALALLGCTSGTASEHPVPDAPAQPSYTQTLPDGPCGIENVTGAVPGVSISIRSSSCVYRRGTAARFTYDVMTEATTPALVSPSSNGGCGRCDAYTSNPLAWVRWNISGTSPAGDEQQYCICDTGCCPPTIEQTIQLAVTTETDLIDWSGRTWYGPSDTGQQEGDLFPPGRYAVAVSFWGYAAGEVRAELPIEILDP